MIAAILQAGVMHDVMNVARSPYPPSFDNNPIVFGWALFARLLVFNLSAATLIRLRSRGILEKIPPNHPVYYHRMAYTCLLWAALLGSLSDNITYLCWGEGSIGITAALLMVSRLLDAFTMVPFMLSMFVPIWVRWLFHVGALKPAPTIMLGDMINDLRSTWDSRELPIRLLSYSAVAAVLVTAVKYWLWIEHGRA